MCNFFHIGLLRELWLGGWGGGGGERERERGGGGGLNRNKRLKERGGYSRMLLEKKTAIE